MNSKDVDNIVKICLFYICIINETEFTALLCERDVPGELDPERIGSGIQYGDTALRRLSRQQRSERRPDCSCWLWEIPVVISMVVRSIASVWNCGQADRSAWWLLEILDITAMTESSLKFTAQVCLLNIGNSSCHSLPRLFVCSWQRGFVEVIMSTFAVYIDIPVPPLFWLFRAKRCCQQRQSAPAEIKSQ